MKTGIGLFGNNGHQVFERMRNNPDVELVAVAGLTPAALESIKTNHPDARCYRSLVELLQDKDVQLVSLCSPVRARQAREAMLCMQEGKHVYAEKPCATSVTELELLVSTAEECGVTFHDMAGTSFDEPYRSMGEIVRSGVLGEVVQVLAQKSYPYFKERPQDEAVDGGLLCQAGIHAFRMIEHVAGRKILEVSATETKLGNPFADGNLHMAASYAMKLEGGAVASVVANYLNQPGFGSWGNETLRIFGTKGFVEAVDGGARTRLVVGDEDRGPLQTGNPRDYFDIIIAALQGKEKAPMTTEEELHPTRAVLVAKQSADLGGGFLAV